MARNWRVDREQPKRCRRNAKMSSFSMSSQRRNAADACAADAKRPALLRTWTVRQAAPMRAILARLARYNGSAAAPKKAGGAWPDEPFPGRFLQFGRRWTACAKIETKNKRKKNVSV